LAFYAVSAVAQTPRTPGAAQTIARLEVQQSRFELRAGESAQIPVASDTLDFLLSAKTRRAEIAGGAGGFVVGPNRGRDQVLLAASVRTEPGEYTVTLSATSATGEERQTTLDVVVKPLASVPSNATRAPVVVLNGWEVGYTNSCPVAASSSDTFGNLEQYLRSDGVPQVYLFDNCVEDPGNSIEALGNDLGTFLNSIKYDSGAQVPQIDLVAHGMGGLIARAYLAGLQPTTAALLPPTPTLVGKLVLIATPNFGSFVAGNYIDAIAAGTQSAELIPGSALLWNLATWNQRTDDLRGVSAIAIAGNAGTYVSSLQATTTLLNASDGLVSLTSASLGFVSQQSSATRVVPYCHVDPAAFTNTTMFGTFACNAAGIANVTSTSHPTGQIVRSFLGGTTDWQSIGTSAAKDPYMSLDGAWFFALVNPSGGYVGDLSQVTWGTVTLQFGGDSGTIFYDDFIYGTGTFMVNSQSLGSINCGSIALPLGYTTAARCKMSTYIYDVTPLATNAPGRVVNSGAAITINGGGFQSQCANGCQVIATPAGSATGQALQVTSWSNTAIVANLPASFSGLVTITVKAAGSASDAITIMAVSPATIAATPTGLQFAYTAGGATPAAQTIQIANSGTGTLAWSATASDPWLIVSPASGTAPASLSVSVSPGSLSAGVYQGTVHITAGASNSPVSIAVTLTVTQAQASLTVTPQTLAFQYTSGGAAPAAQSVAIANAAAGTLSWTAADSDFWVSVSPLSGTAPSTLSVSVNPANLAPGTYTSNVQIVSSGAVGGPAQIAVTFTVQGTQPAPAITAVANGATFQPGFASATWVSIFGTNLSQITYTWQTGDYANGMLPTNLRGVAVTIDGVPAYIEYISPTQINLLAPDDTTTGPVQVQVSTAQQASNSFTAQKNQFSPAFFTIGSTAYIAAEHANYSYVGPVSLSSPGYSFTPAAPGETISLYGTGFGPTTPPTPSSQLVSAAATLANSVTITIGGVDVPPLSVLSALVAPGLYQFNVTVPNLPNGDAPVVAKIGGVSSQSGVSITIQQ